MGVGGAAALATDRRRNILVPPLSLSVPANASAALNGRSSIDNRR
jgi:hypothetical protein